MEHLYSDYPVIRPDTFPLVSELSPLTSFNIIHSAFHFIPLHPAPSSSLSSLFKLNTEPPSSEPTTVNNIAKGANVNPILFDGEEEEEFLPHNLQQPITDIASNNNDDHPDISNNNDDHLDLTPPEDQSTNHFDLNDHLDQIVPEGPRRSNRQRWAPNESSRLEKAVQGVRASAQWKQEEKTEQRKNLADIREEERRNEPRQVEEEARRDLGNLDNPTTLPRITDQILPSEELHNIFKKLSIWDNNDVTNNSDTILSTITECSALSAQHLAMDAPKNWEEAQKWPEAAEWKKAIDEELKSLKNMEVYKLVQWSQLPHNAKIRKGLIILTNKIDANRP